MENKVYYGEYSLKHWIDLILKENIILPEYQRHFVWNEDKVRNLFKSLKNKHFIPPVIIGAFNIGAKQQNLILDGQQRLTSVLLAYLDLYPDKNKYADTSIVKIANENDDDDGDDEQRDIIEWTLGTYIDERKNKKEGYYNKLNLEGINDSFLSKTFLGFAYLVPANKTDSTAQQKYYSSAFRNINIQGVPLLPQESRKSLYFLDDKFTEFFAPHFSKTLTINKTPLDFVRYLSLLSQYHKEQKADGVANYYGKKMEKYYEEYIYSIVGENDTKMFNDFTTIFPDSQYKAKFDNLQLHIKSLVLEPFVSIIDADVYLFGLIYEIVFKNKNIDETKKDALMSELGRQREAYKKDYSHRKTPSALKHLRSRIDGSIDIYKKYVI